MIKMHNGESHDFNMFTTDMFGHDWFGWFGIVIYFLSVLSAAVAITVLVYVIFDWVVDTLRWRFLNWKADRQEKKDRDNAGKHK